MADLVARGPREQDAWRRTLTEGSVTLGRLATKSDWAVPWDPMISGIHATLTWQEGRLSVRRWPDSRNPILCRKLSQKAFTLGVGESFSIGKTTFTLQDSATPPASSNSAPDIQITCTAEELRQVKYFDAGERVEVLAELPDMIRRSPSDEELEKRVLDVLLRGVPRAGAVFVVRLKTTEDVDEVEVRARASRTADQERVRPSRRLVGEALHRRQSVLYRWDRKDDRPDITTNTAFDWALCVPLPEAAAPGWGLYMAGLLFGIPPREGAPSDQELLKSDLKFAEAVTGIFAALRQVRELQAEQLQVRASLQVAKEIQAAFFPRALPAVPGFELAAASRSADETGGDYYDVLPLGSGRFGLVVADVCGHGLGPSLLMASLRAVLRGLAFRKSEPEALLGDLNQAMYEDLRPRRRFITLLYGALDAAAHRFHYANAGHGPVVLHLRPARGEVHTLVDDDARGCPLGILLDPYKACTPIDLAAGDLLVLGTDGIAETRRGGEQFGVGRIADFILGRADRPLQQTLDELMEESAAFHENGRPDDDLTLLIVRRL